MKLTPHEEKILRIIKNNPKVVDQPAVRESVAKNMALQKRHLETELQSYEKEVYYQKIRTKSH